MRRDTRMTEPITTGEAARILRVAEDTVRKFADDGRLNVVRASNGSRIFERADVEALAVQRNSVGRRDK